MSELISIVIPVYNVETRLEKCIESACSQTYQDLEIILVDDGSTDSSGQICDKWQQADSRVVAIHCVNKGCSAARNVGIDHAHGKYIAFLDSDDYVEPDMYESLYKALKRDDSDIAICAYKLADQDDKDIEQHFPAIPAACLDMESFLKIMFQNPRNHCQCVVAWDKLYKMEIFQNRRYLEGVLHEDEFMLNQLMQLPIKISIVEEELYTYVQMQDSIVHKGFSVKRIAQYDAFRERLDVYEKMGFGEACMKSLATKTIDTGIRFWLLACKEGLLGKEKKESFYRDIVSLIKRFESYSKGKQRLLWKAFCLAPAPLGLSYKILKPIVSR